MADLPICLRVDGEPVACRTGQVVLEALQSAGRLVQSACSGRGVCGLCRVHVSGGHASPPTAIEQRLLDSPKTHGTSRLACQMRLTASVAIVLPQLGLPRGKNNDK